MSTTVNPNVAQKQALNKKIEDAIYNIPARDRAEINRENAQHSTGPVTAAGREKAKYNSVKHGACAQATILPGENEQAFEALTQLMLGTWNPSDDSELALVATLAENEWRMRRLRAAETRLWDVATREQLKNFEDEPDPEVRRGLARAAGFCAHRKDFSQLDRHEARLQKDQRRIEEILAAAKEAREYEAKVEARRVRLSNDPTGGGAPVSPAHVPAVPGFVLQKGFETLRPNMPPDLAAMLRNKLKR